MTAAIVGLDVGGTKTALRAADASGSIIADVVVPSEEWDAEPVERAARIIRGVVDRALPGVEIAAMVVGAQGLDNDDVSRDLRHLLQASGYPRVSCVNDAALVVPAAGIRQGIGLIAGTGAIGVATAADGRTLIAGGWGWAIGDDAGAAGLVREATKSALLAHDDGLPDDGLLRALLDAFGVQDAERLARAVNDDPTMANWAPRAPAVFAAADSGSTRARSIILRGAEHLARLVDQLVGRGAVGHDVVAAGSVIVAQPLLADGVRDLVAERHPGLSFRVLRDHPVAGALTLARALAG